MYNTKLLYYDRIDVSETIDVNRTTASKEYINCHYWFVLDKGFKFQPKVSNGCHDILIMSMNLSYITILNIHGVDFPCIINGVSKSEAICLLKNANLNEKSGTL